MVGVLEAYVRILVEELEVAFSLEGGNPWLDVNVLPEELENVNELDEGLEDTKLVLEL